MSENATIKNQNKTGLYISLGVIVILLCVIAYMAGRQNSSPSITTTSVSSVSSSSLATVTMNDVTAQESANGIISLPAQKATTTLTAADTTPDDEGWVSVKPAGIETSDATLLEAQDLDLRSDDDHTIVRESYHLAATRSYSDWVRTYEAYLPKFGSEIDDLPGAAAIRNYFSTVKLPAAQAYMKEYLDEFAADGKLWGTEMEKQQYDFTDYSVDKQSDFLTVIYRNSTYAGGAHPNTVTTAETFDATDGHLIKLDELFATDEDYQLVLGWRINKYQQDNDLEDFGTGAYTGHLTDDVVFYLTADGATFVFNPYDIAPYVMGPVFINIPQSELYVGLR